MRASSGFVVPVLACLAWIIIPLILLQHPTGTRAQGSAGLSDDDTSQSAGSSSGTVSNCSFAAEVAALCWFHERWQLWATDPCSFERPCEDTLSGVVCYIDELNVIGGHVQYLDLSGLLMPDEFPTCIFDFCYLKVLDLSQDELFYSIPTGIGSLTYLVDLDLSNNQLAGSIPTEIGNLSQLRYLFLNNNILSGEMPTSFGQLSGVMDINLSQNSLNGVLPDIFLGMSFLLTFDVSVNDFSGDIPKSLFLSTVLQYIFLADNGFSGEIPSEVGDPNFLYSIDLSSNDLTGSIPHTIGQMIDLNSLDLSSNTLNGQIPNELFELGYLYNVDLSHNKLSGSIPTIIGEFNQRFNIMDISSNQLQGTLPESVGLLSLLITLDVSDNELSGTVPSLGELGQLQYLNLQGNGFSGDLPNITSLYLSSLQLGNNEFTGEIPTPYGTLTSLTVLDLSENSLSGSIPESLANLHTLSNLDLSLNNLKGTLPSSIFELPRLKELKLTGNELKGTISENLVFMSSLSTLFLDANILNGTLSSQLLSYLQHLTSCDISSNCVKCSAPSPCRCNYSYDSSLCDCVEEEQSNCYISGKCYSNQYQAISDCKDSCDSYQTQLAWSPGDCSTRTIILACGVTTVALLAIGLAVAFVILCKKRHKRKLSQLADFHRISSINDTGEGDSILFPLSCSIQNISFGGVKPSIDQPVSEEFVITNPTKQSVMFSLSHTKSEKFKLEFEPECGTIEPGKSADITVKMTFYCTTKADIQIKIDALLKHSHCHYYLCGHIDSKLSTRLDPDDCTLTQPPVGDGSFGTVYRGVWRGTDVAVKVLKFQVLDEDSLREFMREIQMMEEIRSIYCINFIGAVTIPGKYSIITEFCEHGSLASVLKKFSLCYCMKVKMACDAAKGMHYLHTNGIIHRDFKPDNLLVCSLLIDSPVSCKLTGRYTMGVGTLMYLAPELLSPDKADAHYDKSCDVFA
ncbi:Protein kinase domain [Pelomyxa schiedti]|nr:Protein kinase domain [Pelomyxa schiedti]